MGRVGHMHMCWGRGHKREFLELELLVLVSCLMWILGPELRSSVRGANILKNPELLTKTPILCHVI